MTRSARLPALLTRVLLGLVLMVCVMPAWAGVDASVAESLLRNSGLWTQLADVAAHVRGGMKAAIAQGRTRPSDAEMERLLRAVDSAYSPHGLRSACVAAVAKELDAAHVAALRRWYDGSSAQAITRLEEAQSRQDSQTILEQGAAQLRQMPSTRRRILDELVLATHSAELMTDLTIGTTLAAQQGAASVLPPAARPSLHEMKAVLDARRHAYMRSFAALSLAGFAAMYSSLPNAELEKYVDFLKSEAGRHYIAVTGRAIGAAMLDAAANLGRTSQGFRDKANT